MINEFRRGGQKLDRLHEPLFEVSHDAGKELALLYSLVVSCTRVDPVEDLADVLARTDKTADADLAELLPDRWKPPPRAAAPIFDA